MLRELLRKRKRCRRLYSDSSSISHPPTGVVPKWRRTASRLTFVLIYRVLAEYETGGYWLMDKGASWRSWLPSAQHEAEAAKL